VTLARADDGVLGLILIQSSGSAMVQALVPASPAARDARLQPGDIVVAVDGGATLTCEAALTALRLAGAEVTVTARCVPCTPRGGRGGQGAGGRRTGWAG